MRKVQPVATGIVAFIAGLLLVAPASRAADIAFSQAGCECKFVAVTPDRSVYATDSYHQTIFVYGSDGQLRTTFFQPTHKQFHPFGIAATPTGDLAVAADGELVVMTTEGHVLRTIAVNGSDVAVDGAGTAFLTDGNRIEKVSTAGGTPQELTDPSWIYLSGLTFDPSSGHLFAVDQPAGRVIELRTDGTVVRTFGSYGSGPGQLEYPTDVAVGPDGAIYVSESGSLRPPVKRFDAAGNETAAWNPQSYGGATPNSVTLAGDYLYVPLYGVVGLDLVHPTVTLRPAYQGFAGAQVYMGVTATLAFTGIQRYDWDFDDDGVVDSNGISSRQPDAGRYRWSAPGDYTVSLDVIGNNGASTRVTLPVSVSSAGVAPTVTPAIVVDNTPVMLDASQPVLFESGFESVRWDLDGNGSYETDGGASPTVQAAFKATGKRTVGVRVVRDGGAVDTGALDVDVHPKPPSGPVGVSINDGDKWTNDPNVTLDVTWPAGVDTITASNDGGFRRAQPKPAVAHLAWKLLETGRERQPKTVYLRFDDRTQTLQDDIILDQTDPAIQSAAVAPAAGARAAGRHRYRLRLRATDHTSGVGFVQVATRRSKPARAQRYRRSLTVTGTTRPVWVRVRDRAGNNSRWRRLSVRR